jgi:hypothetical protein
LTYLVFSTTDLIIRWSLLPNLLPNGLNPRRPPV